jgi:hypothetical protein
MSVQEYVLDMTIAPNGGFLALTEPQIRCSCLEECYRHIGMTQCKLEKTSGYVITAKIKGPNGVLTVLDRTKEE